jgi:hypothetical protein
MQRIKKLTNLQLLNLATNVFWAIDSTMKRSCDGGLCYGWDWPTFGTLFPRKAKHWRNIVKECKSRNMTNQPFIRTR